MTLADTIEVSFIKQNFGKYDPMDIESYLKIGGFNALKKAVTMKAEDIAQLMTEAEIKGRGGAAYPLGRKWLQAREVKGNHKLIICNADEGETCTFKDRTLIEKDPFNLIEAMIICAYTVQAQDGYIYLREEYRHLRPILLNAIKQTEEKKFLGENILGKGFNFKIHLYSGAGAYVCGEGTALVRSIEGKAGRPRLKPPYIKVQGAFNLPTCVNNVETLSIVPHLILDTKDVYKNYGVGKSHGTKLVSVAGNVKRPGVYEVPFGVTVRQIIYGLAGGIKDDRKLRLIQFGGASGKISDERILDVPYTYEDLEKNGVTVGTGAIFVLDERMSVLEFLRITQHFFMHESCGQCTPCRQGNLELKNLIIKLEQGKATVNDIDRMEKIAMALKKTTLCGLGEAAPNALLSAMKVFPEVFQAN